MSFFDFNKKYKSAKEILTKSKTILLQYITTFSGVLTIFSQQIVGLFNDNKEQIQVLLDPKYFAVISISIGVLTAYFAYKDKIKKVKGE